VAPVGTSASAKDAPGIRVYSPEGKLLRTFPLEIKPMSICTGKDGSIFVAGDGKVVKLDAAGKVVASAASPMAQESIVLSQETQDMVREMVKISKKPLEEELARMKANIESHRAEVTALAATGDDVFMVAPSPNDFTYRVYRFDQALSSPKLVVDKLRGCCGLMDIACHDGKLWIAHNSRHAVESRDRDGAQLSKFGTSGKVKAEDFGGCCEPKNVRVLANGDILAAESEPDPCIKRFSPTGKFLGVVAMWKVEKPECVRVTVEASPDASRYYLLDIKHDAIRVFAAKK
jgi:hypothetical protein